MQNPFSSKIFNSTTIADVGILPLVSSAINGNGWVVIRIEDVLQVASLDAAAEKDRLHSALQMIQLPGHLLMHRASRVKSHIKRSGCVIERSATRSFKGYTLKLYLPALLCMPDMDPVSDLLSLYELLSWFGAQCEANPDYACYLTIYNRKTRNKTVYGEVDTYRVKTTPKKTTKVTVPDAVKKELLGMIDNSDALQHLIREIALSLGKLGQWSNLTLDENCIFGVSNGPHAQKVRAGILSTIKLAA